jgi:hypothetical protein
MYSEPIILPLNADSRLYALQDEQGRIIGTGTREICEVLLSIITNDVFKFGSTQTAKSEMKQTIG